MCRARAGHFEVLQASTRQGICGYRLAVLDIPLQRLDPICHCRRMPALATPAPTSSRGEEGLLPVPEAARCATGAAIAIPEGYAGFVQPRSGLALKHGVTCLNTPGLIDAGYRGELKVLLINTDPHEDFLVKRGERIAQLVIQRVEYVNFSEVDELPPSERGSGGFGSTG